MIAKNATELGALLRSARQARGMSQQQLATAVGVSRQWVVGAEQGAPTARIDLVLTALRLVDLVVDVVPDDSSRLVDSIFGTTDE